MSELEPQPNQDFDPLEPGLPPEIEDMDMVELTRELAKAEVNEDHVEEGLISDALVERMLKHSQDMASKLQNSNAEDVLLENVMSLKDNYVDKLLEERTGANQEEAFAQNSEEVAEPESVEEPIPQEELNAAILNHPSLRGLDSQSVQIFRGELDNPVYKKEPVALENSEADKLEASKEAQKPKEQPQPQSLQDKEPPETDMTDKSDRPQTIEGEAHTIEPENELPEQEGIRNKIQEMILERYGFKTNNLKFMTSDFIYVKGPTIVNAYEDEEQVGERFDLLYRDPKSLSSEPQRWSMSGSELLKLLEDSDRSILSRNRPQPKVSDKDQLQETDNRVYEKQGANMRNSLRRLLENGAKAVVAKGVEPEKLKLHERVQAFIAGSFTRNLNRDKKETSRLRKVAYAIGGAAVGLFVAHKFGVADVWPGGGSGGNAAGLVDNLEAPEDMIEGDNGDKPENPVGDSSPPVETAPDNPRPEAASQTVSLNVNNGDGFTHVIDNYADSRGTPLSDAQEYEAYQHLMAQDAIDHANTYWENGELRIADPDKNVQIDKSDLKKAIKKAAG